MNIKEDKRIKILNYNEFNLSVSSNVRSYFLEPFVDEPSMEYVTYDEIEYINFNTNGITTGLIRFEKEKEKDIYEALGIEDWKDILTNKEIENILINPTKDGIKKILSITDVGVFDRIKTIFVRLKETPNCNLSIQTIRIIEKREQELKYNIFTSQILVDDGDINKDNDTEILKKQIAELQNMVAKLSTGTTAMNINENNTNVEQSVTKRGSGRPKK